MEFGENNRINLLILSGSNPNKSAGIAAKDILNGFRAREEYKVRLVVKAWDTYNDKDIISLDSRIIHYANWFKRNIKASLRRIGLNHFKRPNINKDYDVQEIYQTKMHYSTKKILKKSRMNPDIILIIFTPTFLNAKNIFELYQYTNAKIYWQLVDMAPFTGLCNYAWQCLNYQTSCGKCPAIYSDNSNDISRKNHQFKIENMNKTELKIIIGSNWLISRAKKSTVFKNKTIYKVFLSVDENLFNPYYNKEELRIKYNIPKCSTVIGFGANNLNDKRKGIQYIVDALNYLAQQEISSQLYIIYSGNGQVQLDPNLKNCSFGNLTRNELPSFYRCCDFFINTSIQEVGPYMMIEALMCGVPVISFKTGFADDFIFNNKTGFIVNTISYQCLAQVIEKACAIPTISMMKMQEEAHQQTRRLVSLKNQINSYINIFKEDGAI